MRSVCAMMMMSECVLMVVVGRTVSSNGASTLCLSLMSLNVRRCHVAGLPRVKGTTKV